MPAGTQKVEIDVASGKVTLKADFLTDGYHGSKLFDQDCPGISVHLRDAPDVTKDNVYEYLDNSVSEDNGPDLMRFHVKIYGTLKIEDDALRLYAIKYLKVNKT